MASTKNIIITVILLIVSIVFFGWSTAPDVWVQNHFYNIQTREWLIVQGRYPWLDFILYDGIKKLIIIFFSALLLALLFGNKHQWVQRYRRVMVILVLSGILVPSITVALKTATNVPCPRDWQMYGGEYPHVGVLDPYPKDFCQENRIRCWPAGHASLGFSLLALAFAFKRKKAKAIALGSALAVAWSMGLYKIFKGDHFLSHTIIAMVMAWLIILIIVRLVDVLQSRQGVQ